MAIMLRVLSDLLIEKEATVLFILGDIIDAVDENLRATLDLLFPALASLCLPIYLIPGNHDRPIFEHIELRLLDPNVHVILDLFMCLSHPNPGSGTPPRIFLAHDGGNAYRIRDFLCRSFIMSARHWFASFIKDEDFLLMAHLHTHVHMKKARCASLAPFLFQERILGWGFITAENGFRLEFGRLPKIPPLFPGTGPDPEGPGSQAGEGWPEPAEDADD
jgi:DNA repair exonuclease SbcCD nuclease subunit